MQFTEMYSSRQLTCPLLAWGRIGKLMAGSRVVVVVVVVVVVTQCTQLSIFKKILYNSRGLVSLKQRIEMGSGV
jgi:hypothetical protein